MDCPILKKNVCLDKDCKYYDVGRGCLYENVDKAAYKKLASAGIKVEQEPQNRK